MEMDDSCLFSIREENGRRDAGWRGGFVFGEVQLTLQPLECAGKACGVSQCRQPLSDLSVDTTTTRHCSQNNWFRVVSSQV